VSLDCLSSASTRMAVGREESAPTEAQAEICPSPASAGIDPGRRLPAHRGSCREPCQGGPAPRRRLPKSSSVRSSCPRPPSPLLNLPEFLPWQHFRAATIKQIC
jgi:hypothetical protein